jgi:hypothetical protein
MGRRGWGSGNYHATRPWLHEVDTAQRAPCRTYPLPRLLLKWSEESGHATGCVYAIPRGKGFWEGGGHEKAMAGCVRVCAWGVTPSPALPGPHGTAATLGTGAMLCQDVGVGAARGYGGVCEGGGGLRVPGLPRARHSLVRSARLRPSERRPGPAWTPPASSSVAPRGTRAASPGPAAASPDQPTNKNHTRRMPFHPATRARVERCCAARLLLRARAVPPSRCHHLRCAIQGRWWNGTSWPSPRPQSAP